MLKLIEERDCCLGCWGGKRTNLNDVELVDPVEGEKNSDAARNR